MDRDLVVRAQEGDHDAFARLVAGSIGRLNAVARLILHDHALAEDAVQDAFVDAWRNLRGLRDPDRFDAWLNRLLVRACVDSRRRRDRRGRVEVELLPTDEAPVESREQALVASDQVTRGFRRLTLDQRVVLVLAYHLDLPLAEAAATLGIPLGTMKSRLSRALDALRAAIEADERQPKLYAETGA